MLQLAYQPHYRINIKPRSNYIIHVWSKRGIKAFIIVLRRLNVPHDIVREIVQWLIKYTNILRIDDDILLRNIIDRELRIVCIGHELGVTERLTPRYEITGRIREKILHETVDAMAILRIDDFEFKRNGELIIMPSSLSNLAICLYIGRFNDKKYVGYIKMSQSIPFHPERLIISSLAD